MYRIMLTLALVWPTLSFADTPQTLYINANLIHPEDNKRVDNGYLLVRDGRFVSVGQSKPTISGQHQVVDLKGPKAFVAGAIINTQPFDGLVAQAGKPVWQR